MEKNALKLGPVSDETAQSILGVQKFKDGGGWGKFNGRDVYLCCGMHKDDTFGWAIKQIGRSF